MGTYCLSPWRSDGAYVRVAYRCGTGRTFGIAVVAFDTEMAASLSEDGRLYHKHIEGSEGLPCL